MEELERLYNELPYFDKQKFIGRHLADARQEDIDDKASKPQKIYRYWDLDPNDREMVRMEAIDEASTDELKEELECRGYIVTTDEAFTDELKEKLECRGYIVTKASQEPKK